MSEFSNLPHLLKLLDDDSEDVRSKIEEELLAYGPSLREQLMRLPEEDVRKHRGRLDRLLIHQQSQHLRIQWPKWMGLQGCAARLEEACGLLAYYLSGLSYRKTLRELLLGLAEDFRKTYPQGDEEDLARFLFWERPLRPLSGPHRHPQGANLVAVLDNRQGTDLSLCCIYILVGQYCGFVIEALLLSGRVLARLGYQGKTVILDCGQDRPRPDRGEDIFTEADRTLRAHRTPAALAEDVMREALIYLIKAYHARKDHFHYQLMSDLFVDVESHQALNSRKCPVKSREEFCFKPGDVVEYQGAVCRGLVVEADNCCEASDEWYFNCERQPFRHQPWYHILVHDSNRISYVAEDQLRLIAKEKKISHPLIEYFFAEDNNGRYIRNNTPWPQ